VRVPRARIEDETGKVTQWRSKALPRYQRLTKRADALIAAVCLAGTNTRGVKRARFSLFEGALSKDVVSRAWRKVKVDRDAWCARSLADEDIVRLILDGTVIRTRLERKATNISSLAAIGVRRDGQKVLLSIRNMGGESTAAWRQFLDDLDARGPSRPEFVIVDGAPGLEAALVALWGEDLPIQRCTVHKPQTSQLAGARPQAHARRADRGLPRHDLRRHRGRDRDEAQGIPSKVAPEVPRGCRQPGGSRRQALHLHPPRSDAMEVSPDTQPNRAPERGVPPPHQDPDRAALRQDRAHAALGAAGLRPDPDAQGRRMRDPLPAHHANVP
jgi:hypothetical protein